LFLADDELSNSDLLDDDSFSKSYEQKIGGPASRVLKVDYTHEDRPEDCGASGAEDEDELICGRSNVVHDVPNLIQIKTEDNQVQCTAAGLAVYKRENAHTPGSTTATDTTDYNETDGGTVTYLEKKVVKKKEVKTEEVGVQVELDDPGTSPSLADHIGELEDALKTLQQENVSLQRRNRLLEGKLLKCQSSESERTCVLKQEMAAANENRAKSSEQFRRQLSILKGKHRALMCERIEIEEAKLHLSSEIMALREENSVRISMIVCQKLVTECLVKTSLAAIIFSWIVNFLLLLA